MTKTFDVATESAVAYLDHDFEDLSAFIAHVYKLKEIAPKNELILKLCKDKSVLDLGCIDHSYRTALELGDNWLHAQISTVAKQLVGLDVLKDDAAELNRRGFHIEVVNAEDFQLGRTFDVIVAGDLIEHLSNIGLFLECVSRHMRRESILVITTPNPFNIEQFFCAFFRNKIKVNLQHAVWMDPVVMYQLVSRSPLRIVDFKWVDTRFKLRLAGKGLLPRTVNLVTEFIIRRKPILRPYFAVILKTRQKC